MRIASPSAPPRNYCPDLTSCEAVSVWWTGWDSCCDNNSHEPRTKRRPFDEPFKCDAGPPRPCAAPPTALFDRRLRLSRVTSVKPRSLVGTMISRTLWRSMGRDYSREKTRRAQRKSTGRELGTTKPPLLRCDLGAVSRPFGSSTAQFRASSFSKSSLLGCPTVTAFW